MIKTEGIVLTRLKYGDTGVILHVLTPGGKITAIAQGVYGKRSNSASVYLREGNLLDFLLYRPTVLGGMHRIKETVPLHLMFQGAPTPLQYALTQYACQLVDRCINGEQEDVPLFRFLCEFLIRLDGEEIGSYPDLRFTMEFTRHLGFYPSINQKHPYLYFDLQSGCYSPTVPPHAFYLKGNYLDLLYSLSREDKPLQLTKKQWENLWKILMVYYELHLSSFKQPASLSFLKELTSLEYF